MKIFSWVIAYVSFACAMFFFSLNYNLKKIVAYQDVIIENLETKVEKLEVNQSSLDWFESELEAIDRYISVIDQLKMSGSAEFPELKRTVEEMNKARFEVVQNAVYWDRELNKREEEK